MKKRRLIIFLCILFTLFLTVAPCAQATPYVYVEMTGASLEFEKSAASQGKTTITFSSYPNLISGASYPSDPIIGKYEVIYVPPIPPSTTTS